MLSIHHDKLDDLDADRYLDEPGRRSDIEELAASIAAIGVLEPLVVIPRGERWTIYAGHRRRAAARRAAELVAADPAAYGLDPEQAASRSEELLWLPCYERADLDRPGVDVLAQIAENRSRMDIGDASVARGLQLALLDGLDAREIAHATGVKVATVRSAQRVAQLPDTARDALAGGQLALDDAAQLEEFSDDAKAIARILRASHFGYALADERLKRDAKAAVTVLRGQLTAAGYQIITKPKDYPWASQAAPLRDLADAGERLVDTDPTPTAGHAVFIETGYGTEPRAVHVCLDPEAHGHERLAPTRYVTPEEARRRAAEEEDRDERARQMAAANEVRRPFLTGLIGSQKAAARHMDILTTVAARWPSVLSSAERRLDATTAADASTWTPRQAQHRAVTLAVLGADQAASSLDPWRRNHELTLWWWERLATLGYELTPAEQAHRDATQEAHNQAQATIADAERDHDDEHPEIGAGEPVDHIADTVTDEAGEDAL